MSIHIFSKPCIGHFDQWSPALNIDCNSGFNNLASQASPTPCHHHRIHRGHPAGPRVILKGLICLWYEHRHAMCIKPEDPGNTLQIIHWKIFMCICVYIYIFVCLYLYVFRQYGVYVAMYVYFYVVSLSCYCFLRPAGPAWTGWVSSQSMYFDWW